jgi:hypothetical protein
MSALSSNTTYYVRAFATNSTGTSYGNQVSFNTGQGASLPTVTTQTVNSITQNSAVSGGDVTNAGGSSVTSRGICYYTSPNPTTSNLVVNSGSGTGAFTSNMSALSSNTTYYVRAFATNSTGTSYGNQVSFNTIYQNCSDFSTSTTFANSGWSSSNWWTTSNPNDNSISNDWISTGISTLSKNFTSLPSGLHLKFSYGDYWGTSLSSNQSLTVKVNGSTVFSDSNYGDISLVLSSGNCAVQFIANDNDANKSINISDICIEP